MIDLKKLSDVQSVVDSLSGLPRKPCFILRGMQRDGGTSPKRKEEKATEKNDPALNRAGIWRVILCLLGRIFGKFEFQEDLHKWKSRGRYEYLIRLFTFGNLRSEFLESSISTRWRDCLNVISLIFYKRKKVTEYDEL